MADSKTNNHNQQVGTNRRKREAGDVRDGIYKRGKSWYIRVMVNGKLIRKSAGPHKDAAELMLAEIKKERARSRVTGEMSGLNNLFKKQERRKFADMAAKYMDERPHLKPSTKRGYEEIFRNYLIPQFGELFVDEIREELIANFQAKIAASVSATRVNNIMGPLRYVLKVCHRRKLIDSNPALNVLPLQEADPIIDPLTQDELDRVLAAMKPYQRPLFICLAWTGARPDELFALRWDAIDFTRGEIHIKKGRVRGIENSTKTKAGTRVIPMLSIVGKTLAELSKGPRHIENFVFLNKHGLPYDKHVDREWRTALRKAGVRHRPSYQLRHTFASLCLQRGVHPTWVAKVLGHSTPAITFKHYARFIDDGSHVNENKMEEYIAMLANEAGSESEPNRA